MDFRRSINKTPGDTKTAGLTKSATKRKQVRYTRLAEDMEEDDQMQADHTLIGKPSAT